LYQNLNGGALLNGGSRRNSGTVFEWIKNAFTPEDAYRDEAVAGDLLGWARQVPVRKGNGE
jgi:hypothetical protein